MKIWPSAAALSLCAVVALPLAARQSSASGFFSTRLPAGFPVPHVPEGNPISEAKVALGRSLFYDKRFSGNGTYSCGSCHQQALAFADGLAHAVGSTGESHSRSSMSLTNVAYNASFGWDERRDTLESQMEVPMYNVRPIEMGLKGREVEVLARFTRNSRDVERFREVFPGEGSPVTVSNIVKAIASFERVLISGDSLYDRSGRAGLPPAAKRGADLFFSARLRCSECHSGVNLSGPTIFAGATPPDPAMFHHDTGVALQPAKFRPPTLRNIAVTAPYMHNGSMVTLRDVIHHYAQGGRPRREKSERVQGFAISASEIDDLLAFLQSLTDQAFLTNPALGDPHAPSSPTGPK